MICRSNEFLQASSNVRKYDFLAAKTNDLATVGTRDAVIDYGKVFSIVEFNTKKLYKYQFSYVGTTPSYTVIDTYTLPVVPSRIAT